MLKGKTAVITGASSGIGQAVAICFAGEGAALVVTGRNQERLSAVAAECREKGSPEVVDIVADLSKAEEVQRLGKKILDNSKEISILVNNAASAVVCTFMETTSAEFDRVMSTNVRAPFLLSQALLPSLTKNEGCIINISSLTATKILPKGLTYGMSKAALNHFTEALAFEKFETIAFIKDISARVLAAVSGFDLTGICPGTVKTRQLVGDGSENKLTPEEVDATMNFMATCQPLGTLNGIIAADDIAKTVLFLASPCAKCITGQTISVDAGYNPYHAMTPQ